MSGPGTILGHLRLTRELGQGGMGQVFLAQHVVSGAEVAVKLLREHDPDALERFRREGTAQAAVSRHPNVVGIHSLGSAEGTPYLVMDFASGGSLADRLRRGPLPAEEARRIVAALADGLQHLHEHGVLHRDLKPDNVLFTEDGRPQLVDFGLARDVDAETLTQTGEVLGTPAYMAPEQALGRREQLDATTDVYGLGGVLYHCLTGHPPFQGPILKLLHDVVQKAPVPPRKLAPGVPTELERTCLRALAKERAGRFSSAAEFATALREPAEVARRPGVVLVVLLVLIAAGTAVGLQALRGSTPAEARATAVVSPMPQPAETAETAAIERGPRPTLDALIARHGDPPRYRRQVEDGWAVLVHGASRHKQNGWSMAQMLMAPKAESKAPRWLDDQTRLEYAVIYLDRAARGGHLKARYKLGRALLGCAGSKTVARLSSIVRLDRLRGRQYLEQVSRAPRTHPDFLPKHQLALIDALAFSAAPVMRDPLGAALMCQERRLTSPEFALRSGQFKRLGYGGRPNAAAAENNFGRALLKFRAARNRRGEKTARWRLAEVILFGRGRPLTPDRRQRALSLLEDLSDPQARFVRARALQAGWISPGPGETTTSVFQAVARDLASSGHDPFHDRLLTLCRIEFEGWAGRDQRSRALARLRSARVTSRDHPLVLAQLATYEYRSLGKTAKATPAILELAERAALQHVTLGMATYLRAQAGRGTAGDRNAVHFARWTDWVRRGGGLGAYVQARLGPTPDESKPDLKTGDPRRR